VLKLSNRARVKSNQSEVTGDIITYDMRREVAEVSGAPAGKGGTGSRVKAIIVPPKKGGDAKDADKPAGDAGMKLKPDPGKP
jgi:lipopolysaccharide export system protein LptA